MGLKSAPRAAPVHSVKELLARGQPGLKRVTEQLARTEFWSGWLAAHLAPELRTRVAGVARHNGTLTIFAETAAWSARLRFALQELEREMRAVDPELSAIKVRVRPRG